MREGLSLAEVGRKRKGSTARETRCPGLAFAAQKKPTTLDSEAKLLDQRGCAEERNTRLLIRSPKSSGSSIYCMFMNTNNTGN